MGLTVYAEGTSRLNGIDGVLTIQYNSSYFTKKNIGNLKVNYGFNVDDCFYMELSKDTSLISLLNRYKRDNEIEIKGTKYFIHECTLVTCEGSDVWSIEIDISKDKEFCPCYFYVPFLESME